MPVLFVVWVLVQAPDYDAFSDRDGRGLIAMLQRTGQLVAIFAEAEQGNERARRIFRMLETDRSRL